MTMIAQAVRKGRIRSLKSARGEPSPPGGMGRARTGGFLRMGAAVRQHLQGRSGAGRLADVEEFQLELECGTRRDVPAQLLRGIA